MMSSTKQFELVFPNKSQKNEISKIKDNFTQLIFSLLDNEGFIYKRSNSYFIGDQHIWKNSSMEVAIILDKEYDTIKLVECHCTERDNNPVFLELLFLLYLQLSNYSKCLLDGDFKKDNQSWFLISDGCYENLIKNIEFNKLIDVLNNDKQQILFTAKLIKKYLDKSSIHHQVSSNSILITYHCIKLFNRSNFYVNINTRYFKIIDTNSIENRIIKLLIANRVNDINTAVVVIEINLDKPFEYQLYNSIDNFTKSLLLKKIDLDFDWGNIDETPIKYSFPYKILRLYS